MRLIGTGKDPRYPKGLVFDSAEDTRECKSLVDAGWATVGEHDGEAPGYFGDQRTVEIAQAAVRGDTLSLPHEAEVAEKIAGNEHAIVHTDNASATVGDDVAEAEKARKVGHLGAEGGPQKTHKRQSEPIETDTPVERTTHHRSAKETARGAAPAGE
jgi:hypothetical protein